jgi:hypothetical protein
VDEVITSRYEVAQFQNGRKFAPQPREVAHPEAANHPRVAAHQVHGMTAHAASGA